MFKKDSNVRPGYITCEAKFKCPKRLNSSFFLHDFLFRNVTNKPYSFDFIQGKPSFHFD